MRMMDLSLVKPGMRLSLPACLDDMTLLAAGVTLTERHIERLTSLGVQNVAVDVPLGAAAACGPGETAADHAAPAGEGDDPAAFSERDRRLEEYLAQRQGRLEWLFRRHADDPWMRSVRGSLEAYFHKKLSCLPGNGGDAR